jgi:undecaprenyl diphosphate synthase
MRFRNIFKNKAAANIPDILPRHIAIIMDGNGRWAKMRRMPRTAGHAVGAETFKKIVTICGEIGISYLTVYAFSTENWNRSKEEVAAIMNLLSEYLDNAYGELKGKNVKVNIIGERHMLSDELVKRIEDLEAQTKDNTDLVLNIALSYGGRQEIVNAAKQAAELAAMGRIKPEEIDEKMLSGFMYTAGQPDPDLIIRPSGEYRISNFLLWQAAYSEFWFSNVLWPSFNKKHLVEAIRSYSDRERRFGK